MTRGPVVWAPGELAAESQLARYMRWLAREHGRAFAGYEELWAWSVADLEGFWASIWRYFDIRATPYEAVLGDRTMRDSTTPSTPCARAAATAPPWSSTTSRASAAS
jgi:acetoacetyl-CoA synthetase